MSNQSFLLCYNTKRNKKTIKTRISAVTSVTYGLLSALIIAVIVGGLSAAGVGVENVFSAAGNGIAVNAVNLTSTSTPAPNPLSTPNLALLAFQQSQITNSAAEIAAGTASAACLQYMNNATNAASMASNNATCLGPGEGIAPPALPVAVEGSGVFYVETNGLEYAYGEDISTTSATPAMGSDTWVHYSDGIMEDSGDSPGNVTQCQTDAFGGGYSGAGSANVINGNGLVCSGITAIPVGSMHGGSNQSAAYPFGYDTPW